jgi:hypothetical protein
MMKQLPSDKADIVSFPENETQRVLREALKRLDGGRIWRQGPGRGWVSPDGNACALGAVGLALGIGNCSNYGEPEVALKAAARERGCYGVEMFNDTAGRTFAEIEALFLRAVELAAS